MIYIPNVDSWYNTVGSTVISTFTGLLRTLPPTDPILLLGVVESEPQHVNKSMLRDLFGFSKKNQYELTLPKDVSSLKLFILPKSLGQADSCVGMARRILQAGP